MLFKIFCANTGKELGIVLAFNSSQAEAEAVRLGIMSIGQDVIIRKKSSCADGRKSYLSKRRAAVKK